MSPHHTTCDLCDREMVARKATRTRPYRYVLSGLSNVQLIGIEVFRCPKCKGESPIVPCIGPLHREIAMWLFSQEQPLDGEQLKYLRKYAGLRVEQLAHLACVESWKISRAENGTQPLDAPVETLVRLLCIVARGARTARLVDILMTGRRRSTGAVFEPCAKTWRRV